MNGFHRVFKYSVDYVTGALRQHASTRPSLLLNDNVGTYMHFICDCLRIYTLQFCYMNLLNV